MSITFIARLLLLVAAGLCCSYVATDFPVSQTLEDLAGVGVILSFLGIIAAFQDEAWQQLQKDRQ